MPIRAVAPTRKERLIPDKARLAIVGCGAIARECHIPVLAGHDGVRIAALVERDVARGRELAQAYGVTTVLTDARELDPEATDAALIATPPFHHASCAIDLMRRGIHVLVEKPMAMNSAECEAMIRTADESGVVLAVGHFRRLFPSMRMLRAAVESGLLGRPTGFDIAAGSIYGWGLATLASMRKDQGGGGVLMDMAPHVVDQLLCLFDGPAEVIEYRDNARGGIESDCIVRLRIQHRGNAIDGRIELSRTRKLRNTIRIECERGTLELPSGERYRVSIVPRSLELIDPLKEQPRPYRLEASWQDEPETLGYGAYRAEIDAWLRAIRTGERSHLSGESALPTLRIVEECYASVQRLHEPWVEDGIPSAAAVNGKSESANGKVPAVPRNTQTRRVLVTGATGFIGCRAAEILALRDGWQLRALVRSAATTSRLARLPVEMLLGDLRRPQDVAAAVAGCDAVVHCAIGTAYGNRTEIFDVTVEGTRRLAEAARAAGVGRFVHVSTVAVHGRQVAGVLDESTPVLPPRGDDYAESKAEAERLIERAVRAGLPAVTLRPANVYGPFGATLITRPIQRLGQGLLAVRGGNARPSNTVYVDNVAHAIACALDAPAEAAVGETFAISDGEATTWADFYGAFARELNLPAPAMLGPDDNVAQPRRRGNPLRWLAAWLRGSKEVLTSAEAKALAKRCLRQDAVGALPRWLLRRSPWLERRMLRLADAGRPLVYELELARVEDPGPMILNPIAAFVSPEKARRRLGFAPAVPTPRAIELTLLWLRNARIIP